MQNFKEFISEAKIGRTQTFTMSIEKLKQMITSEPFNFEWTYHGIHNVLGKRKIKDTVNSTFGNRSLNFININFLYVIYEENPMKTDMYQYGSHPDKVKDEMIVIRMMVPEIFENWRNYIEEIISGRIRLFDIKDTRICAINSDMKLTYNKDKQDYSLDMLKTSQFVIPFKLFNYYESLPPSMDYSQRTVLTLYNNLDILGHLFGKIPFNIKAELAKQKIKLLGDEDTSMDDMTTALMGGF
ncbi:MAG: hypothetical protein PHS54_00695 [Clostridia bacterium]|nr:hypothetical protein [Clostridia bacterium]